MSDDLSNASDQELVDELTKARVNAPLPVRTLEDLHRRLGQRRQDPAVPRMPHGGREVYVRVTIYYWCLHCTETGETTGTESGADAKHVKATAHSTATTTRADMAARCGEATHG